MDLNPYRERDSSTAQPFQAGIIPSIQPEPPHVYLESFPPSCIELLEGILAETLEWTGSCSLRMETKIKQRKINFPPPPKPAR